MTFREVEKVLGFSLPVSAYRYPAWWSNEQTTHVQARSWMRAGFETENVDRVAQKLVFRNVARGKPEGEGDLSSPTGMAETAQGFMMDEAEHIKADKHPAFGALKGTFVILPRQEPLAEGDEEWVEWENAVDRKGDLYLERLNKNK